MVTLEDNKIKDANQTIFIKDFSMINEECSLRLPEKPQEENKTNKK
jgi:hypothetical protein